MMRYKEQTKLLIVDGCDTHRLLYEAYFKSSGYQVFSVKKTTQAVAYINITKPDLIILDVDLPDKDGFEMLAVIRDKNKQVPIIINTGYAHFRADVRCWAADAFMIKSSNVEGLEMTVKNLLDKRQLSRSDNKILRSAL